MNRHIAGCRATGLHAVARCRNRAASRRLALVVVPFRFGLAVCRLYTGAPSYSNLHNSISSDNICSLLRRFASVATDPVIVPAAENRRAEHHSDSVPTHRQGKPRGHALSRAATPAHDHTPSPLPAHAHSTCTLARELLAPPYSVEVSLETAHCGDHGGCHT